MPPELINEEIIEVNDLEKIDLFSLGVMLFHFAFHFYPYEFKEDKKEEDKKIMYILLIFFLIKILKMFL